MTNTGIARRIAAIDPAVALLVASVLAIVGLIAFMVISSANAVTSGRVDALTVVPAHSEVVQVSSINIDTDGDGDIDISTPVYGTEDVPEGFRVDLRTAEGDTGSVFVDRPTFEDLSVGQYADLR
jgi:hypothetical protein